MTKSSYAHQVTTLADLPGEKWVDVPDLTNCYRVSNLGRVRRLQGQGKDKRGYMRFRKEMIISPVKRSSWNAFLKEERVYLGVSLVKEKKIHNWGLARLVCYCFVQVFDLKDKNNYVLYKDGDPMNVAADNLYVGTPKDKNLLMQSHGRKSDISRSLSSEEIKLRQLKINAIKKQNGTYKISRYSVTGKLLETYQNAVVAGAAVKIFSGQISAAAREGHHTLTAGGYIWRRGSEPEIDVAPLLENKSFGMSPLLSQKKRVGQYDYSGKLINAYSTVREAARAVGITFGSIHKVISGKRITAGGFIWRLSVKNTIPVKHLKPKKAQKVSRYDLDGKWIQTYNNVPEAAKMTRVFDSEIYKVLNDKALTAGNFIWRYGESLRIPMSTLRNHPKFKKSVLEKYLKSKRQSNLEAMMQEM